jgi:acetyl esterase/lipase
MIVEKIDLYQYFNLKRCANEQGYLTAMCISMSNEININRKYPAMLIIPGGGYEMVSDREGEPVALEFINKSFNTFILNYSVTPNSYPVQLLEAAMAMIYIRENSKKYNIDNKKVSAIGFSAGGHLCGCLATIFDDKNILNIFGAERSEFVRPDAVILSYPVITSDKNLSHVGSIENVSGGNESLKNYLSLENRVTENSSPAFIWHTMEDNAVPVENSIFYAKKCREKKVPFELHIFEKGSHGLSVCNEKCDEKSIIDQVRNNTEKWVELSINWLEIRKINITE